MKFDRICNKVATKVLGKPGQYVLCVCGSYPFIKGNTYRVIRTICDHSIMLSDVGRPMSAEPRLFRKVSL